MHEEAAIWEFLKKDTERSIIDVCRSPKSVSQIVNETGIAEYDVAASLRFLKIVKAVEPLLPEKTWKTTEMASTLLDKYNNHCQLVSAMPSTN
jgi:hypothetical protein